MPHQGTWMLEWAHTPSATVASWGSRRLCTFKILLVGRVTFRNRQHLRKFDPFYTPHTDVEGVKPDPVCQPKPNPSTSMHALPQVTTPAPLDTSHKTAPQMQLAPPKVASFNSPGMIKDAYYTAKTGLWCTRPYCINTLPDVNCQANSQAKGAIGDLPPTAL